MSTQKNILIIYNSIDYFIPFIKEKKFSISRLWEKETKTKKLFIAICNRFGLTKKYLYNRDWRYANDEYDVLIYFVNYSKKKLKEDIEAIEYIKFKNKNIRVIFWYWNSVCYFLDPTEIPSNLGEIWSFDNGDCSKYSMKLNTTFYLDNIFLPKKKLTFDILFVGFNKGRRAIVNDLTEIFKVNSLSSFIYILPDKDELPHQNDQLAYIQYREYLDLVARSRCILDILPKNQTGMTLRPMESIFFQKKLISNDYNLISADFYNPNNIFIVGIDNFNNLFSFINSKYEPVDVSIIQKYDFASWVERFSNSNN